MVSARGVLRTEGFLYALDNGAWTASEEFRKGLRPTPDPCLKSFCHAVGLLGPGADFIVVPDIVQGGARSWAMTRYWLRRLRRDKRLKGVTLMIAVQDGYTVEQVGPYIGPQVGIFIGGGDEFKEQTLPIWGALAHSKGAPCHAARVNTTRRVHLCNTAKGIKSFDGSSASRWAVNLRKLDNARHQLGLFA